MWPYAARQELTTQLGATRQQFHEAAERLMRPVILEAKTADRLSPLNLRIARKLNDHSQKALAEILARSHMADIDAPQHQIARGLRWGNFRWASYRPP